MATITHSTLPPEVLNHIFGFLPSRSAFPYMMEGERHSLVASSHVSRDWRAVAVPILFNELVIYCDPSDNDILAKFARFLTVASFRAPVTGEYAYTSFVRTFEIWTDSFYHGSLPFADVTAPIINIIQLFSRGQIQSMLFRFPTKCERGCCDILPLVSVVTSRMGDLRRFELHHVNENTKQASRLLAHLPPSLEKLYIEDTSLERNSLLSLDRLFRLPNIRDLTFYSLQAAITTEQLERGLAIWGPKFRRLSLIGCPALADDQIIFALARHCPNLTVLELGHPFEDPDRPVILQVSDASMCRLIDACVRLQELYCGDIASLSDAFLAHCAAHARGLKKLTILSSEMTGWGVTEVHGWAGLEELAIADVGSQRVGRIDKEFRRAVVEGCPAMKECRLGNELVVGSDT
ncbi:hypothetical protein BC938DRAFT_475447 [Jimgerdemannia flammicorona]|uniref:F-box domain-containing protein n=1 Tax=Jimgerdemannia flammicorona TaxID=994334 RepID=A0A433PUP5_9FUNG|nr:hypothetical protein BC938DRAFT_475447 [Jimgerdemannia flammicorona]